MKLYLAAPLFTQSERIWNRRLAEALAGQLPGWEVILPQDFKVGEQFNRKDHYGDIFRRCIESIDQSGVVVAILDGADSDAGVAFEMGYAYARQIPVIGVRTDFRDNQERGVNLMLSRSTDRFVTDPSFMEDSVQLAKNIAKRVKAAVPPPKETRK